MPRFQQRKNIVFFSVEGKCYNHFQAFGGPYRSPNISRLKSQAICFENMESNAASTVMSLATVLNGRFAHELNRLVYASTNTAKSNLFALNSTAGRRCYLLFNELHWEKHASKIYDGPHVTNVPVPITEHHPISTAKKVVELAQESDQPFFIFAHCSPESFADENLLPDWVNTFERCVYEDDQAVGILLDNLDLNDTMLVFYSDHGTLTGEHGHLFWHGYYPYQPVLHVPCLISSDQPSVEKDLYGLKQLHEIVSKGEMKPISKTFADTRYVQQPFRITSVREGDWKYIAHYSWASAITGIQEELYHLTVDPNENRNLLLDISRHTIHKVYNIEDAGKAWERFSYDQKVIEQRLAPLRKAIAQAWLLGFIPMLQKMDPSAANALQPKLELATDVEKLAIVATLVDQIWTGETIITDAMKGDEAALNALAFPGLPSKKTCTNFSPLLSPNLDNLFSAG